VPERVGAGSRHTRNGCTHTDTANTFQDTINDVFSRAGQLARDSSGSIGDILAEYDFNGLGRQVRRVHDEGSGAYGNDTKMDLWHGTTGTYAGLDRFGRIVNMKFTNFNGSPTDFERRKYGYDRNSNRTYIEHSLYKADSQSFTLDNLNRLTEAKTGILNSSNVVEISDVGRRPQYGHSGQLHVGRGRHQAQCRQLDHHARGQRHERDHHA
jgi:hypothetical protein